MKMNDLQKHNQGLIQSEGTLLVKVPDDLYQQWWEFAVHWNMAKTPIPERQEMLLSLMSEWVRNDYPGYGIIGFQDLTATEAMAISKKINQNITWGMYILLQIGGSMQPISITDKLLEL
jgi:hypothetical protein